mmetsp:Transcript_3650/g.8679  ORF Transcript_3650/g.8679 Transcript_3650/m.8679 type:complete len:217 (-) Transcript_3650:654-1304(-)
MALGLLLSELYAEPEVGHLYLSPRVHQHVVRLDIAVYPRERVEERDRAQRPFQEPRHLSLGELEFLGLVGLQQVRDRASVHVFHHDPEAALEHVALDVSHHVRVRRSTHHRDLVLEGREVRCLREREFLDCHAPVRFQLARQIDGAHPALPDRLGRNLVLGRRVVVEEGDSQACLEGSLRLGGQRWLAPLLHLEPEDVDNGVAVGLRLLPRDLRAL